MDYEKAYKEAIKRAKAMIEVAEKEEVYKSAITIFPELAESEDERIRRELIRGFNECLDSFSYPKNAQKYWHGIAIEDIFAWLEKQGNKPKKVSVWKHWKDGIAGNAEGKQIYLIKIGDVYSISSCLGCECDYIELSELDKLMREEKQRWQKWNEEDIKFIDMLIKEKEDALCLSCDVKESISLTYCCNALKLIKQRMKEQL